MQTNKSSITPNEAFVSHMLRYVGIGLISGSIVHAGTLGGGTLKYIVLIIAGIICFTIGNLIEYKNEKIVTLLRYIGISVVVSLGTGMVSGATQHYLDGPVVGAMLLSLGMLIAYISFLFRDYRKYLSVRRVLVATVAATVLWGILLNIAHSLPERVDHHANDQVNS